MGLSRNPNITSEIVKNNRNEKWNYYWLSVNPNITWEIVKNNPNEYWDWYGLSRNTFSKARENRKKYNASVRIQRVWEKYWYYPYENEEGEMTSRHASKQCELLNFES